MLREAESEPNNGQVELLVDSLFHLMHTSNAVRTSGNELRIDEAFLRRALASAHYSDSTSDELLAASQQPEVKEALKTRWPWKAAAKAKAKPRAKAQPKLRARESHSGHEEDEEDAEGEGEDNEDDEDEEEEGEEEEEEEDSAAVPAIKRPCV